MLTGKRRETIAATFAVCVIVALVGFVTDNDGETPLPEHVIDTGLERPAPEAIPSTPSRAKSKQATGTLVIRVVDEQGERIQHPATLRLTYEESNQTLAITGGEISLDGIPVGRRIAVTVSAPDGRFDAVSRSVRGPQQRDKIRTVTIPFAEPYRLVKGRLLSDDGTPLAGQAFRAVLTAPDRDDKLLESIEVQATTGADGAFRLRLPRRLETTDQVDVFAVIPDQKGPGLTGAMLCWKMSARGDFKAGDIHLRAPNAQVRGRIVDQLGTPLLGAHVTILRSPFVHRPQERAVFRNGARALPLVIGECETNKQGYFTWQGTPAPGLWEIAVFYKSETLRGMLRASVTPGSRSAVFKVTTAPR